MYYTKVLHYIVKKTIHFSILHAVDFSHRTTFYFTIHTDCNWTLKPQFRDMFLKKRTERYICTAGFSSSQVVSVYILLFQRTIEIKKCGKFKKRKSICTQQVGGMQFVMKSRQQQSNTLLLQNPIQFRIRHDVLHTYNFSLSSIYQY